MDLSAPYRGVLSVLAGTNEPLTGREVARLANGARSTVARILGRLVEHGVVRAEEAGPSRLYSLNREKPLAEPLLALVRLRGRARRPWRRGHAQRHRRLRRAPRRHRRGPSDVA